MKTFVPSTKLICVILMSFLAGNFNVIAQSGPGGGKKDELTNGLSFKSPRLETAANTDLKKGAVYLFKDVRPDVDARLTITDLVNGAKVTQIDDNAKNLGYESALQPEIQSGNVIGRSYAVFTINFYKKNTMTPEKLQNVNATALDIDGTPTLKEFSEVDMGAGAIAKYMSTTLDISLLNLLLGKFRGENLLGIERDGIDTTAFSNMYTTSNSGISSIVIRYGTNTLLPTNTTRQFSMYMKGFTYPNQITLPVELVSFSAMLNTNDNIDLRWTTSFEKNVSHFVVERSLDGKEFTDAGVVFAYGNTSDLMNYTFTDKSINVKQAGILYYRLRSEDIDGKKQFSGIRVIRLAKEEQNLTIVSYPNPVTNELRVTVPRNWQGKKVSYEVLNNNGRLSIRTESGNSSQTETINVSNLSSGIYMVRVTCNGEAAIQKIIKQ